MDGNTTNSLNVISYLIFMMEWFATAQFKLEDQHFGTGYLLEYLCHKYSTFSNGTIIYLQVLMLRIIFYQTTTQLYHLRTKEIQVLHGPFLLLLVINTRLVGDQPASISHKCRLINLKNGNRTILISFQCITSQWLDKLLT